MRAVLLLVFSVLVLAAAEGFPAIRVERLWPETRLREPVDLVHTPGGWLVVERAGTIRLVGADGQATLWADLTGRVSSREREEGLLALVLHPQVAKNRQAFLWYTTPAPRRDVLARITIAADGRSADPASVEELIAIEDPYWNHNGSDLVFGPDGFLYLSPGDGGGGGDPLNAGQRLDTLLGKILRIDVDRRDGALPYAIPADNPFVGRAGARPEIWAWGIRNVWRMSFDRTTGELWAGDVGQNKWEEIDVIVRGGNYGWNIREGLKPFKERAADGPLIDPVVDYGRGLGQSVTGGYVYRGTAIPGLVGAYVYADFQSGRIFALRRREGQPADNRELLKTGTLIATFAEDAAGELYFAGFGDGGIWRIRP